MLNYSSSIKIFYYANKMKTAPYGMLISINFSFPLTYIV